MNDKRAQWEQIKQTDPKLAELLLQVNKTFGKPELLNVKLKEEKA